MSSVLRVAIGVSTLILLPRPADFKKLADVLMGGALTFGSCTRGSIQRGFSSRIESSRKQFFFFSVVQQMSNSEPINSWAVLNSLAVVQERAH